MTILTVGAAGPQVEVVQQLLQKNGYYQCGQCKVDGDYGELTASAVQEFQGGHLDDLGQPLEIDGEVGPATLWALHNASGETQRLYIDPLIPRNLPAQRKRVLEVLCAKYRTNVREIPDGSNAGDGVDEITGGWAAPWCAMTVWWAVKKALDIEPWGSRGEAAAVINIYKKAKAVDTFKEKDHYPPRPGDVFIMLYRNKAGKLTGKGHTGVVLRVSEDGQTWNTLEGNAGNRLACIRFTIPPN